MSYTLRVLAALAAGMALGIAASTTGAPWLLRAAGWVEPIGVLFVNAIRLAVIPLVVASLIVGIAGHGDSRRTGRLGARALAIILVCLVAAAVLAMAAAYPLFAGLHVDAQVVATLTASGTATAQATTGPPSIGQWFVDLVPGNVFRAASDGALLPLVVFAIGFGL